MSAGELYALSFLPVAACFSMCQLGKFSRSLVAVSVFRSIYSVMFGFVGFQLSDGFYLSIVGGQLGLSVGVGRVDVYFLFPLSFFFLGGVRAYFSSSCVGGA